MERETGIEPCLRQAGRDVQLGKPAYGRQACLRLAGWHSTAELSRRCAFSAPAGSAEHLAARCGLQKFLVAACLKSRIELLRINDFERESRACRTVVPSVVFLEASAHVGGHSNVEPAVFQASEGVNEPFHKGLVGAGDGNRTRDVQLGKLAFYR